ncbi:unnamed protein product [Lymnaea stagnalis]|uniref:Uncharacterized protein n=1 Tax=Lymnaea stagnalis TaxID=6523 RepID=A0AAV2HK82_LYMST
MFISCNAIGVYPEPRCVFVVYDNIGKVKLQNEAMTRQNKVHSGNITQYKAACDFNISDSLRNHELRVDVIMYPHITGQFTDLTFGTNATVTLDITNKAENYIEKLTIDILCTFAITAVCIVVVAAIAFYCYKKGVINFLRQRIQGTLPHQVEQEPNQLGNNDGRNDRVVRENVNEDTTLGDSSEATRDDDAPNISEENSNRNDEELDDEHGDVERRVNLSEDGTQPKFIGGACGGVDNCEKEPCIVKSVLYTKYNDSGDPEEGVSLLYPR